jgi:hypothetical protein
MKKAILTALVALTVFVAPVLADVAVGEVGAGAQPGDQPPKICIYRRNVIIGTGANPPGVNPLDWRTSLYAFTGEQIEYTVVVRDPNGALDIGFLKAYVGDQAEVLANPASLPPSCDGLEDTTSTTDMAFHILISVEPSWYGDSVLQLKVGNSQGVETGATHTENWFFNPAISLSVTTSDGSQISFEPMDPTTRFAHSTNKIKVKNTAEGGVNLWMFIAGTDLYDPSGASKCPDTNYIAIDNMWYRGWSGTQWQSGEGWYKMHKYNQNDGCSVGYSETLPYRDYFSGGTYVGPTCYGGLPVPMPRYDILEYILTNQGTLEVEFKLQYPTPCIGSFSEGTIYIFGKAV